MHMASNINGMGADWNLVTALAAVAVTAVAAVITAAVLVWQTRQTLRVQALNQLLSLWQSSPMFPHVRKNAALAMSAHTGREKVPLDSKTFGINEVLDFFETVAVFTKRRVPGEELTYSTFYWPMSMYWVLVRDYILETQKAEGEECWKEYNALMTKLIAREGREPTLAEAQGFLDDELVRCSLAHALSSRYTAPYGSD
jgi:hypothetical protein